MILSTCAAVIFGARAAHRRATTFENPRKCFERAKILAALIVILSEGTKKETVPPMRVTRDISRKISTGEDTMLMSELDRT